MTAEQLEELLGKVTPGPWYSDGPPWNQIVWTDGDNRMCFMAHSSGLNDDRDIANASLIAMAPSLASRVICAEKLVEALESVLEDLLQSDTPTQREIEVLYSAYIAYREASK